MSINLTTTQTEHKPIYIYTYRQKPLKLLKIKKGPIDKTFHKTSGFDSWQRISMTSRSQVVSLRSRTWRRKQWIKAVVALARAVKQPSI